VDLLQHLSINGLEVYATNDATWATSVLIHSADKTQAQPPTLRNNVLPYVREQDHRI
jgi:hypothetical protein